jgi:DnaK suppressor protein
MISQEFIKEMEQRLLDEQKRLKQELAGLPAHTEMGDGEDDNAEEIEVDEASRAITSRVNSDLEKIEKALKKIEQGTYGVDDDGREISQERLRAIPWADKSI